MFSIRQQKKSKKHDLICSFKGFYWDIPHERTCFKTKMLSK